MQAFETLPTFDLFTSVIVLQHNPPPIIAMLLKGLLCKLRPGGIAYFQVPTYKHDYGFTVDKYLQDAAQTQGMEMHVIPQHVLFDLLRQCGCQLLECREDGWSGDSSIISNTIFARKENGPIRTRSAKTRIRSLLDLGVGSLRGGQ
jgi:hypothetical protein